MNGWSRIRPTIEEWPIAMRRAGNRCEGQTGARGARCAAPATEVVAYVDGRQTKHAAVCVDCRRRCFGAVSGEKAAATRAFKAREIPLFGEEHLKPVAYRR